MIDPLITNPKQDNDLQLARTASIPANEKYQAKEWNAIVDKINEIINDLSLGQITDSVTKTTATNIVRLVEGALIETNLTIRNLPEATTEQKMILLNSLGEAALADISDYGGELKKIGDGYGLQHQVDNPDNYGTLGQNAVNLSFSETEGDFGATGISAHAEGYQTTASGDVSHAEGSETTASGGGAHAEGAYTTASGEYSHAEGGGTTASGFVSHAEGEDTKASGLASHAEGQNTIASSYAENARGAYNEIIPPISTTDFNSNDVVESVGVGTNSSNRKNALTRWKNGAFKWLLQPLTNITNAVLGFHAADEDGRLNYYDGTAWKKYLLEGEGSGGGYIEILDQFNDVNGDVDLDLITEEGLYFDVTTRDQSLNGIEGLTLLEPHLINVEVKINEPINTIIQKVTYFGYASDAPNIVYRINNGEWTDWRYMVDDSGPNGVTPTVTASVITNYDIDPQLETEHWNLTMTGNTNFDFTNMFASGNSKVITITLEGDYAFAFPIWLKPLETNDEYDTIEGSLVAEIVINIKNGGTIPSGYYSLQMVDYAL